MKLREVFVIHFQNHGIWPYSVQVQEHIKKTTFFLYTLVKYYLTIWSWFWLTSGIWKALPSRPAVWAGVGEFLVRVQAGLAVDPPTAWHLVGSVGHRKTDLAHQLVRWSLLKLTVIPSSQGSIGGHFCTCTRQWYGMIVLLLHDLPVTTVGTFITDYNDSIVLLNSQWGLQTLVLKFTVSILKLSSV